MYPQLPLMENEFLTGGIIGILMAFGILILLCLILAWWIYTSFAWKTIAEKKKFKKSWLAWIPFARSAMVLELGKFNWQWIFLILLPFFGWITIIILITISKWRIFESLKYPGWLSLAPFIDIMPGIQGLGSIANIIILGIIAWSKK